ncbi:MAG: hypothetical protein ABH919_03720 [bacterium]
MAVRGYRQILKTFDIDGVVWDWVEFLTQRPYGSIKMNKKWNEIVSLVETGGEREYRLAIIEASEMLNKILKNKNYKGKNLEERLNQVNVVSFPPLPQVIEAQKICQDQNHLLTLEETKGILKSYKEIFECLTVF